MANMSVEERIERGTFIRDELSKLVSTSQLFTHRYSSLFLIIAIAGMLLLKTSMHAEEEVLHHIDTLSLSTLLVL